MPSSSAFTAEAVSCRRGWEGAAPGTRAHVAMVQSRTLQAGIVLEEAVLEAGTPGQSCRWF